MEIDKLSHSKGTRSGQLSSSKLAFVFLVPRSEQSKWILNQFPSKNNLLTKCDRMTPKTVNVIYLKLMTNIVFNVGTQKHSH